MNVDELIQKAKAALPRIESVPTGASIRLDGDGPLTRGEIRFKPMQPDEWREFIAVLPPRPGAYSDAMLGFNVDAATRAYPHMQIVVGDDVTEPGEKWAGMCTDDGIVDAAARDLVAQALLEHHQFEPMRWQDAAGKASRGGRGKKPGSPAISESRSGS